MDRFIDIRLWERIRNANLAEDFAFDIGFSRNKEGVGFMLRTILGLEDISIESVETQKSLKNPFGHSAVFDIFARDSKGNLIDVEMQRQAEGWKKLSKRMALYSGLLTLLSLGKGRKYSKAKDVYVVFILDSDIAGKNRFSYKYRYMDTEDKEELKEHNVTLVLVNGSYRDTIESVESCFCSDLYQRDVNMIKCPEMRKALENVKGSEKAMRKTYKVIKELYGDDIEKSKAAEFKKGALSGKKEAMLDIAVSMLKAKYAPAEIASITKLSLETVNELAQSVDSQS